MRMVVSPPCTVVPSPSQPILSMEDEEFSDTETVSTWVGWVTQLYGSEARLPLLNMPPKRPATSPTMLPSFAKKTRKSLTLEVKLDITHRPGPQQSTCCRQKAAAALLYKINP
ncbi:hypothetical protein E2C01_013883 [Portunus trituberculatus]|uniref:Uncharacterized protein n=1 Tax=Portunus trituberculatus TaxID=210409 RepID=A0A5B7DHT4_PORTR|nr:hypothetical protein [Portunus trituberculatus]